MAVSWPLFAGSFGLQFDGTNDYVTFGPAPALGLGTFTIETWFKRTGPGAGASTGGGGVTDGIPLVSKGRGEADGNTRDMNYFLGIRASDGKLIADFEEGDGGSSPGLNHPVAGVTAIASNVWCHAAATYDGARWRLYLNGALETELLANQPPQSNSIQHAALGSALNSSGTAAGFFQGVLDEVRIWNYARSAQDIANDRTRQIISATGLVGRWSLDEGSGTVAIDSGSGGINGTVVNGPIWVEGYPFVTTPFVAITNPAERATFTALATIAIEASASVSDGAVTNVSFFADGAKVGEATASPFTFNWTPVAAGNYTLTAIARDDSDLAGTSAPVNITVNDPIIRISNPGNDASFLSPIDVPITAVVSNTFGPVTLVEFFANTNKLGEVTVEPYAFTWTNAAPGIHALTAIATLTAGGTHTSAPVLVIITSNAAPVVSISSPTNNALFRPPTNVTITASASNADGLVTNVSFHADGTKLGDDTSAPFTFVWSNAPSGIYALIAVATDDGGLSSTSVVVTVSVATNQFPSVNVTSPTNGASFGSGTDINVAATASDTDGSVAKVEFYIDGLKFRSDATAPYSVVWSNAAAGAYVLTAIATDNEGGATASAPVTITVTNRLAGTNTLISQGYLWKYLDDGSNQGTAWREPAFPDAAWETGVAQFGYGDGGEATVISFGPSATAKYITTYFRRAWNVPDPAIYNSLILKLLRDDGAVVYLNGREVFRSNMPAGTVLASTLATASVSGSGERTFYSTTIAATNLVAGTNVIAVEVHQDDIASSDVSFDFQLLATSGAVAPALTRGPYLQSGTTNSVILRWRTDVPCSSTVRFGTNAANLDNERTDAVATTEHIVPLSGLAADTQYFYSIGTGSNVLASGADFFFVTSPPPGAQRPVRLWVLGDSGDADSNARNVANGYLTYAAASRPADIWLMLGDNAYDAGTDAEYQAAVFNMYPTVLRNRVLWPTIGNHETDQETVIANFPYLDIFSLPQNGDAGGVPSGTERYYSFDYANIHFVCLDSMTSSRAVNGSMAQWLETDLANTVQPWLIAFWHHPPYTKGNHDSDTSSQLIQMRQNILPILEAAGVDLVLCGHSHVYERSYFLREHYGSSWTLTDDMKIDGGDGREEGTSAYQKAGSVGSVYTVCGSSGHTSSGPLNHPAMFVSMRVLGSLVIDVSSNRLDLGFLGTNATLLDHFTIVKGTNAEPPAAPVNLAATLVAPDSVRLTWNNSSTNELGYELERSVDGASFSLFATLGANLTNFTNGLLLPSTVYSYRVRATNTSGASDYSNVATTTTPGAPRIVSGPAGTNVLQGGIANFGVSAVGTTPLVYQWRFNGTDLPNQTNATLTLLNAQPSDAGPYSVRVTNVAGSVISTDAVLAVIIPPTITSQPQSQVVTIGSSASFSVTATGTAPLYYRWQFNGANIADATNSTLAIASVQDNDAGSYAVVVANGGVAVSSNAVLAVNHPPVASSYTTERFATQGVKFRASVLAVADPDGDTTTLVSVDSISANGGNVSRLGGWVIYSPPSGFTNADAFSYELRDSHGSSATGTVTILATSSFVISANMLVEDRTDGSCRLRFSGIPGRLYTIQTADNLADPLWQVLATETAGADGCFEYIDTPPTQTTTRYYRSTCP